MQWSVIYFFSALAFLIYDVCYFTIAGDSINEYFITISIFRCK